MVAGFFSRMVTRVFMFLGVADLFLVLISSTLCHNFYICRTTIMLCEKLLKDFELFHKVGSVEISIDR